MTSKAVKKQFGWRTEFTHLRPAHISVDPGETVGLVFWDAQGRPIMINELSIDETMDMLQWLISVGFDSLSSIIIEEFRLYNHKALEQSGSKLPTVQVIGMFRMIASWIPCNFVEIRADSKETAAKWSQTKWNFRKHPPDYLAAYLIGYYHLHKIGVIPPKVLETLK